MIKANRVKVKYFLLVLFGLYKLNTIGIDDSSINISGTRIYIIDCIMIFALSKFSIENPVFCMILDEMIILIFSFIIGNMMSTKNVLRNIKIKDVVALYDLNNFFKLLILKFRL